MVSLPVPPLRMSLPELPKSMSLPLSPKIVSFPLNPLKRSSPSCPRRESLILSVPKIVSSPVVASKYEMLGVLEFLDFC